MKILIATGIFPPDAGGPAQYSKLLNDELPKHGIAVEILSFGEVRHLPKLLRHFIYFCRVLKIGKSADVIFAQDPVSVGLPACIASKILRKKFALKIVGDYAWEQGMQRFGVKDLLDDFVNKKYGWKVEFLRKIQKCVAKNASVIIVPSEYLKKIITKWGILSEKIKVVYNAFKADDFAISKEEARKRFNLNGVILLSAGRFVPWKGFDTLIEIMPEVLKMIPEARLIIIGEGPERKNLEFKIKNLKLEGAVILTGQISHNELSDYLKAGDLFVLNTGYEGFSHQILEAMAAGIPVITTEVGGNTEIIRDGETGILAEYNSKGEIRDAIIKLWSNEGIRNSMINRARESVKKFGLDNMINQTISLLSLK